MTPPSPAVSGLFEHRAAFDPTAGVEALLAVVPAKWCVYLLADEDDRPVQLLCVKNLRASLANRLGAPDADEEPTRRADLSAVVRTVYYTRVDSAFEQDWVYLEAARACFPDSYRGVLGFYPAWFVHVNPATRFPRLTRQNQVDKRTGDYFGPLPDKHAADKIVRAIEEGFDLCRDWDRLTSDASDPCQWRQMEKCVGPCEGPPGGIGLDGYRAIVAHAADVLRDVGGAVEREHLRMKQAAVAQAYEAAGAIKARVAQLETLCKGNNRHVRPLAAFRFLAVMPAGKEAAAKLFIITPGDIHFLAAILEQPTKATAPALLRTALALGEASVSRPLDVPQFERISLTTSHLFQPKKASGEFIPLAELDDRRFLAACRALAKTTPEDNVAEEGEVRGLQAL